MAAKKNSKSTDALLVLLHNHDLREWLRRRDPKALEQARDAVYAEGTAKSCADLRRNIGSQEQAYADAEALFGNQKPEDVK